MDALNGPLVGVAGAGVHYFQHIAKTPSFNSAFQDTMAMTAEREIRWTDIYDTDGLLKRYSERSKTGPGNNAKAIVVDIGGSHGKDLQNFRDKHSNQEHLFTRESFVLQDKDDVLAELKSEDKTAEKKMTLMSHDFFTPQPVKGKTS